MFTLDCHHKLCIKCACIWIPVHASCPLCRSKCTVLFSKNTRSDATAKAALLHAQWALLELVNTHGVADVPVHELSAYITTHYLHQKHVWLRYRQTNHTYMRAIQSLINDVVGQLRVKIHEERHRNILYAWYMHVHSKGLELFLRTFRQRSFGPPQV
jgi:hypothetical protein